MILKAMDMCYETVIVMLSVWGVLAGMGERHYKASDSEIGLMWQNLEASCL